jgi:hypothetical protein
LGENGRGRRELGEKVDERGRMSCWEGEQWILAWESEGDESRDEKVMVKLIV